MFIIKEMVYLIYGNQRTSIKSRIKKMVREFLPENDDMNFVRFDAENILIQDCILEANYLPLGYDKKVVVVENCYFLLKTKPKNKLEDQQDYKSLINFIEHPNQDCELILTIGSLDVNQKNDIFLALKENFPKNILQTADPTPEQWVSYTRDVVNKKGIIIDQDALAELTRRTECNVALFNNELNKLSLYSDHIKYNDVVLLVNRPLEENSFQIFNFLLQDENLQALSIFKDLKVTGVEPVTMISMLSNQFRLLNQVSYLSKKGLTNENIASELNINPIRAKILRKNSSIINESQIHKTLDDLYTLDLQIKSGNVDRFYVFEMFLINFKRQ